MICDYYDIENEIFEIDNYDFDLIFLDFDEIVSIAIYFLHVF